MSGEVEKDRELFAVQVSRGCKDSGMEVDVNVKSRVESGEEE